MRRDAYGSVSAANSTRPATPDAPSEAIWFAEFDGAIAPIVINP